MDNLISACYVIESNDYGIEPIIYLNKPDCLNPNEKIIPFRNVFVAKNFIQVNNKPGTQILVTKATSSQLYRLAK